MKMPAAPPPLSAAEIRAIREESGLSATVFARHLWVSRSQLERWESGQTTPKGADLKLLTLVKNKGLESIF
jgi:putative transcriptional regulator